MAFVLIVVPQPQEQVKPGAIVIRVCVLFRKLCCVSSDALCALWIAMCSGR